jgi:hypothetical protein
MTAGTPTQSAMHMTQALSNASNASNAGPAAVPFSPAIPGVAPLSGNMAAIPRYAVANPAQQKGETLGVFGLVASILAVPGAIIPFVGMALAITGLIMSTVARSHGKKTVQVVAIVLASIGLLLSIASYIYNLNEYKKTHGGAVGGTSATETRSVTTPCYTTTVTQLTSYDNDGTTCNFRTYDASTANASNELYGVVSSKAPDVNDANFETVAKQGAEQGIKDQLPNATVTAEGVTTFANSKAFTITAADMHGTSRGVAQMIIVLHPTAHGENLFVIVHGLKGGTPNATALGNSWNWK